MKVHQTEKVQPHVRIPTTPDVDEHYCESLAEKDNFDEERNHNHDEAAKQKHENEISCATSERPLLQHTAVTIREDHVEHKVETDRSEKQKVCHQSPYLPVFEN